MIPPCCGEPLQGENMKPLEVAARFAAFSWYINLRQVPPRTVQAEARRFSKESWQAFLPVADEGLGKLLLQVAKIHPARQRRSAAVIRPMKRRRPQSPDIVRLADREPCHVPHHRVCC